MPGGRRLTPSPAQVEFVVPRRICMGMIMRILHNV